MLIVAGLYLILWGKAKEIMMKPDEKTVVISTDQLLSEKPPVDISVHIVEADSGDDKTVINTQDEGLTGLRKSDVEKGF